MLRLALATALMMAAPAAPPLPCPSPEARSATVMAGPPWISIESPPNPYNAETKGALLVVRVYHHGEAAFYPVSGSAEGLQNGVRQSVPLQFGQTSTPGMYTLKFTRPAAGAWLLMIRVGEDSDHGSATAVVSLDQSGQVSNVQVPSRKNGEWDIPRQLSEDEVAARLRSLPGA
jgi:hypothetical protein